ncbi:DMT family transporter [Idiomarina xiamenensis]|uniref:Permease n=1 Tax=Idiomarina xiamenensis 10-D-4 TaxID=740709 RepID=K2K6V3_9GAMM|nr:DMT family transporter [Idiomarina xiamenensis]EKE83393.1 permease [Idiomarina xiamenensis 10-D-4]
MMNSEQTIPAKAWALLFLLAIIWGGSFLLIKKGLLAYTATEVAALRIAAAGLVLAPFVLHRLRHLRASHWPKLVCVGLVGSLIPAFMFALAQTQINSGVTGVLNAFTPLAALSLGVLFFKQSLNRRQVIGLIIGLCGSTLLITASASGALTVNSYALLVIVATICYGLNLNLIKHHISDLHPITITGVSLLIVSLPAVVYLFAGTDFLAHTETSQGTLSLVAILFLGIVGTAAALVIFNHLVQLTNTVFTSSVTYLIPIVAMLLGVLDGEPFWLQHGLGMVTILAGVWIANKRARSGLAGHPERESETSN